MPRSFSSNWDDQKLTLVGPGSAAVIERFDRRQAYRRRKQHACRRHADRWAMYPGMHQRRNREISW